MQVLSEDRASHATLTLEAVEQPDQSHLLAARVVQSDLKGSCRFYVEAPQLEEFITQLAACERTRRGEAILHAMSPDDFLLPVYNINLKGDFGVRYALSATNWIGDEYSPLQLSGGFVIDPSLLPELVSECRSLLGP